MDIASGRVTEVLLRSQSAGITSGSVSPDGSAIVWALAAPNGVSKVHWGQRSRETADAASGFTVTGAASAWADKPVWSRDGKFIYYLSNKDGFVCVWRQPIRALRPAGEPEAFSHFHDADFSPANMSRPSMGLSVSDDQVVLNVTSVSGTIWLLKPRNN